jgi:hypothetical protein
MLSRLSHKKVTLLFSVVVVLCVTFALHREVLWGRAIYHMDDAADNYYPARVAFRRALSEGTLPSWENGAMSGWPLLADPYYGYFYPLNVVFYLGRRAGEPTAGPESGVPSGLGYSAALHMALAGLGMLWLLRRRVSWPAALFGALSFALSSFLVVRIRHIIFVQAMAWLPWLLWAVEHHLQTKMRRSLAAVALFAGLLLLTGAHSLLHFLLFPVAVYVVGRVASFAWAEHSDARACWKQGLHSVGLLGVSGFVGVLVGAVAMLPTLFQMPLTGRALGTEYHFASTYAWPHFNYWRTLLFPDWFGKGEWRGDAWMGSWNHWEIAGYYPGVVALLLALPGGLWGFFHTVASDGREQPIRPKPVYALETPLLLILCFFAVSIALGDKSFSHPFLFRHFPLYAALRCPARALSILVFAVPFLGAFGAEWLLAGERGKKWGPISIGLIVGGACFAVGVLFRNQWIVAASRLPIAQQFVLTAKAHAALGMAGLLGVTVWRFAGTMRGTLPLLVLSALTVFDEFRIARGYLHPQPMDYAHGTERFSALHWLVENQTRIDTQHSSRPAEPLFDRFVSDPRGPFRLLAVGETIGRPSAGGYGSIQIWRYSHLLYILRHGHPYPHRRLKDDLAAAMVWRLDSPLVDMLNVRFAIAASSPGPGWVERFRPAPQSVPSARYEAAWDAALAVFENQNVMPRAFVAYQAEFAASQDEEARLVARADFQPHRQVVVGLPSGKAPTSPLFPVVENRGRAHTQVQFVSYGRHRVVIEADAAAAGMLVLADAFHPGWEVTLDGHPGTLWPINLALRGVALEKGHHRIEMRYRDRGLQLGVFLSLCGVISVVALFLSGVKQDRKMVRI